ncbi:MAG: hypothetical protein ACRD9R_16970 [Pyrinomonadaceae bacterium]
MNDLPRQTLRALIEKYGPDLCSDAGRCGGLLRDLCGAHRREINILLGALKEHVPLDLLAGRGKGPRALLLSQLTKRLEDQLALTEEAARWAVNSWALALGVVTDTEVEESENKSTPGKPPAPITGGPNPPNFADARGPKGPPPTTPAARTQQTPPRSPQPPPRQQQQQRQQQTTRPQPPRTAPPPLPATPSFPSGGPPAARPPQPSTHQSAPAASSPPPTRQTATRPPGSSFDPAIKKTPRRRLRGCMFGCFLIVLLIILSFFVSPYVVSLLREEQQRLNSEPPRTQSP